MDVLILGSPTQGWRPKPTMRDLLEYIPAEALNKLTIACFDTRYERSTMITGSAAKQMAKRLHKRGASHLLPVKSFFVEGTHGPLKSGELEEAVKWSHVIRYIVDADRITAK